MSAMIAKRELKSKVYLCGKKQNKTKQNPKIAFIVFVSIPN